MMADQLKKLLIEYQEATASFNKIKVANILSKLFLKNAKIHLCHPFGTLKGSEALFENCLLPLHQSMPDLERRDMIVIAGTTPEGKDWIGTMCNYMGTFLSPFLDIRNYDFITIIVLNFLLGIFLGFLGSSKALSSYVKD